MKAKDLYLYEWETLAKCPICKQISNVEDWQESEVFCDDCGSNPRGRT